MSPLLSCLANRGDGVTPRPASAAACIVSEGGYDMFQIDTTESVPAI